MGAKHSTEASGEFYQSSSTPRSSTVSNDANPSASSNCSNGSTRIRQLTSGNINEMRQRTRSLTNVNNSTQAHPHNSSQPIVTVSPFGHSSFGLSASPDFGALDDLSTFGRVFSAQSLPVSFVPFNGLKCPVCSKTILSDDVECHLVMCLTKPRISYNDDVLSEDKGECVICLDDLNQGDTIARLPCLCIYHKSCIDAWFEVNRSCPEHPSD